MVPCPMVHRGCRLRQGASRRGHRPAPYFNGGVANLPLGTHCSSCAGSQPYRTDGYFYSDSGEVAKHAKLDEVEIEIRAQIERAKAMGLTPSHLDAHMHVLYATPELFGVFQKVARDYKLPIRMARNETFISVKLSDDWLRVSRFPMRSFHQGLMLRVRTGQLTTST